MAALAPAHVADLRRRFAPRVAPHATPGALARAINPKTVQTEALERIDEALVWAASTPDARLIITMPPQEGKSVRVAGDFPTWLLTRNPDLRVVVASYNKDLATRNGRAIRTRITANPGLGLRIARDNGRASEWTIAGRQGGVFSIGITGGLTGRPADCVTGDATIVTDRGPLPAALAYTLPITHVLAYDHDSDTPVWRRVEAARRIPGRNVVEVTTQAGRSLTCTPDHRVATRRGYVPAGELRHGDALIGLVDAGTVPLRDAAPRAEDAGPQGAAPGPEPVLLPHLRQYRHGGDAAHEPVPVRQPHPTHPEGDVLVRVPAGADRGTASSEGTAVPAVRSTVPTGVVSDGLLQPGLRQHRALPADAGPGQLQLHDGPQLRGVVPCHAAPSAGPGRAALRGVPLRADDDLHLAWSTEDAVGAGHPSHRRGRAEQRPGEPADVVHGMSHEAPQVSDDAVLMVRRRGGPPVDVYDFQVEGTSNFFANGVLVHNCLIIDDPIKDMKEADNQDFRDGVFDWWRAVAGTRLAPGAPVVIILTRWHDDDLAGRLLKESAKDPDAEQWRVLNIPAQADHRPEKGEEDALGRTVGTWLRSARGRTADQWEKIRKRVGARVFAALYQGRPSPTEGQIFPRKGWDGPPTEHDPSPFRYGLELWIERPNGSRIVPDIDYASTMLLQSWDMTFKDTDGSDFVVGQVWLKRGVDVYLLDQVRGRMDFNATVAAVRTMTARWPQATLKLIEDKANGSAIINSLSRQIGGIVPVEPDGSKTARAKATTPYVEAGNIHLPTAEVALFDVEDFIVEAEAFRPGAAHDDQVDAFSQAIMRLLIVPLLEEEDDDELTSDDLVEEEFGYLSGFQ